MAESIGKQLALKHGCGSTDVEDCIVEAMIGCVRGYRAENKYGPGIVISSAMNAAKDYLRAYRTRNRILPRGPRWELMVYKENSDDNNDRLAQELSYSFEDSLIEFIVTDQIGREAARDQLEDDIFTVIVCGLTSKEACKLFDIDNPLTYRTKIHRLRKRALALNDKYSRNLD
jgi:hypothetical protein